jgi:hypothetical protein
MINISQLVALESGVVARLKPLVTIVDELLPMAELAAPELALLFPALAPELAMLKALSVAIKAIEAVAPNLEGNVAALKAAAAPLEADVLAIRAAVEAVLHPTSV